MRTTLLCVAAIAGLAGCVVDPAVLPGVDSGVDAAPQAARPTATGPAPVVEPTVPRDVSQAALTALPAGMSPGFLIKDASDCYGLALEASEPIRGVPLLNNAGVQVCDA